MSGTINRQTGEVFIEDWTGITDNTVIIETIVTKHKQQEATRLAFRIPSAPVVPGGLQIYAELEDGKTISARANQDGDFKDGDIQGHVTYQTGVVDVVFGRWVTVTEEVKKEWWYDASAEQGGKVFKSLPVVPESITYNATVYSHLPLDAAQVGIDPVRLPPDGRVQFIKAGDLLVLSDEKAMAPATVSNEQTLNTGRQRLSRVRVVGSDGRGIKTGYTTDLDAGTVTFKDVAGYKQPVIVKHCVEELSQVIDAQIDGTLAVATPVTHDFPKGSVAATALYFGDRFARVSRVFDQMAWGGTKWQDAVDGDPAVATYNTTIAPIQVTNAGAITERWALKFTSGGAEVDVIGEHVGNIGRYSINNDIAPPNPNAGNAPYFTIKAAGWGGGWIGGNVLFIHTVGALADAWALQCINKGQSAVLDDKCEIVMRCNVDRPGPDQAGP